MAYNVPERATLFALMAQGREVSNAELEKVYKIKLDADSRNKLNRDGLIVSVKPPKNKPFIHELTDKGWAWVRKEFTQPPPPRTGSLVAALYGVLATLGGGLDRRGLTLADLLDNSSNGSGQKLPDRILSAYRQLARRPQDWVYLSELRPLISGVSKAQVDGALKEMYREKMIRLTLEEDQKSLTKPQRDAAVRIGVDDMHLIAME
jgi:hypothetical protein